MGWLSFSRFGSGNLDCLNKNLKYQKNSGTLDTFFSCYQFITKLPEGVWIFCFLFISKLFLNFQSKYNFQSDISYDYKQEKYAQWPPSYSRGHCISVTVLQFCHISSCRKRLKVLDSSTYYDNYVILIMILKKYSTCKWHK